MDNSAIPCFIHPGRLADGYLPNDGTSQFTGTHGIVHELNASGFRDMDYRSVSKPGAITIVAIGCSYVFGYGLDTRDTWLWRFADLVEAIFSCPTHCLNLGVPGASNDYVVRQVTEVVETIQPHIILIAFAQKERLEYWSNANSAYSIRPGAPDNRHWSQSRLELQRAAERMSGWAQDSRRLYQAVRSSSAFCKTTNTVLLYTYASVAQTPPIQTWMPGNEYVGQPFPRLDFATDKLHPGVRSNAHLALKSFARMCARLQSGDGTVSRLRGALGPTFNALGSCTGDEVLVNGELERWRDPC